MKTTVIPAVAGLLFLSVSLAHAQGLPTKSGSAPTPKMDVKTTSGTATKSVKTKAPAVKVKPRTMATKSTATPKTAEPKAGATLKFKDGTKTTTKTASTPKMHGAPTAGGSKMSGKTKP